MNDKKEIQRRRKLKYFIKAAQEIIQKEGIEKVSIRKVADLAGYNSATLYNYFDNLDHLLAFASMQYVENYSFELIKDLKGCKDEYEIFLKEWSIFLDNALEHPKAFMYIFFNEDTRAIKDMITEYYRLFPLIENEKEEIEFVKLLSNSDYRERSRICLERLYKYGYIKENEIEILNELLVALSFEYIHKASLEPNFEKEKYINKFMKCINYLIKHE